MSAPAPQITVRQDAAKRLAEHLISQGRGGNIEVVAERVVRAAMNAMGRAKQATDAEGPLWVIDVSEGFDNECLYAIMRPGQGGVREIAKVVDEDAFETFVRTGGWGGNGGSAPQGRMRVPDGVEVPTLSMPGGREGGATPQAGPHQPTAQQQYAAPQAPIQPQILPEAETLVMWKIPSGNGDTQTTKHHRCTFAQAEEFIADLIRKPDVSDVEVWTNVKRPKLRIELG